jgi:hypothetical protein
MVEAANDVGAAQVAAIDDSGVIDALRRGGDEDTFARLVDQYHASLRCVAHLYIANRAVADEVVAGPRSVSGASALGARGTPAPPERDRGVARTPTAGADSP